MKKRYYILISNILIISLIVVFYNYNISGAPVSQDNAYFLDNKDRNGFESWLSKSLNRRYVPSVVAGVASADGIIYHHGISAGIDKQFDIASLSKTFTAILALQLEDKGFFKLDDPVSNYLPGLKIALEKLKSGPVKIKHLLAHTSGLPTGCRKSYLYKHNDIEIRVPEQVNPAGFCYTYSNTGYVILKHVIESATGEKYSDIMKKMVFEPLEMNSTHAENSNGTGGIVSTFNDISNYVSMLINEGSYKDKTVLPKKYFRKMLGNGVEMPEVEVDYYYSLSWEVIKINGRIDSFYKAGRWFGGASAVQVFPNKGIALIYLCDPPNHLVPPFMRWRSRLTGRLRNLLRKVSNDKTLCTRWPRLEPEELKYYTGTYVNPITGSTVNIDFKENKLFSDKFGDPRSLIEFSSNRFLMGKNGTLHNFVWKDEKVIGLSFTSGFYKLTE